MKKENIYNSSVIGESGTTEYNFTGSFHPSITSIQISPEYILSEDEKKIQHQADIYSINSIKKLNLKRITEFISGSDSHNILLDFCFDYYPTRKDDRIERKVDCLIRHLKYMLKTHQEYTFTILLRGVYLAEYDQFEQISQKIDILCKSYIYFPEIIDKKIPQTFKIIDL